MKTLRFLHSADWHADSDPKKQAKLEASLDQIVEYCSNVKVNAIIHAGDVWEKSQRYQLNSGVPIVLKYLHKLSKLVDFIFITKGNNSHDEPGSIELLHQIESNVYAYEYPVVLAVSRLPQFEKTLVNDLLRIDAVANYDYIITLIPYPTKASLLIEDSIDNNNFNFIDKFEQVFEHIGEVTQPYTCPKILAFHGNVQGSLLSTGQTLVSQDIMIAPSTLEKAKHDYYALGHIHLYQEIENAHNMYYSGSIYNKNWGETEQKSFQVIEFPDVNTAEMNVERIMLTSARPMITLDCGYKDGFFWTEAGDLDDYVVNDEEFRIRISINENERNLFTEDKISIIKKTFGEDVKIEFNIVPVERESRSEKIMNCKTLLDEVKEYAQVINLPINGTIEKKVAQLQEVQQ